MHEHMRGFLDIKSKVTVLVKASRFRGSQLQDLAAAKASLKLNGYSNLRSMIKEGLIPHQLESLMTKYL